MVLGLSWSQPLNVVALSRSWYSPFSVMSWSRLVRSWLQHCTIVIYPYGIISNLMLVLHLTFKSLIQFFWSVDLHLHGQPNYKEDLYNKHSFKLDTQDYCYQFSIWPNIKYGHKILLCSCVMCWIMARKQYDVTLMLTFDTDLWSSYKNVTSFYCQTFVWYFVLISTWIIKL